MEQNWDLQAPKPPLLKGGGPPGVTRWRGDSVTRNSSKQEAPSVTACGGGSSLKEGAFPGGGRRFFYRLGFSRSGRFVSAPFYLSLWERWHGAAVTERAALPSDK